MEVRNFTRKSISIETDNRRETNKRNILYKIER